MKVRVYQLARELRLDNRDVVELARQEGIELSNHMAQIDEEPAARIREKAQYLKKDEPEAPAEPPAPAAASAAPPAPPAATPPPGPEPGAPATAHPESVAESPTPPAEAPAAPPSPPPKKYEIIPEVAEMARRRREQESAARERAALEAAARARQSARASAPPPAPTRSGPLPLGPRAGGGRRGSGPRGGGRRSPAPAHAAAAPTPAAPEAPAGPREAEIALPISVKDFSAAIGVKIPQLLGMFLKHKIAASINSSIDDESVAQFVGLEFGVEVKVRERKNEETEFLEEIERFEDKPEDLGLRSPVVAFLGHVDHGKTSLLDAIRETNVAAGESGGITQHIGAWSVDTEGGKRVVFLDTPGHEAFTAMRARGAQATDVVVLVVAADDGVMPQTEEAIAHAKAASVPIVVALNKIDKKNANPIKVRQQLASLGLADAQWGGKTEIVETSAVTRQGISDLVETLALEAEVLDLKANPKRPASGVILEARRSEGKGILIHALVQNGTLRRGDNVLAGKCFGRVRAIHDYRGRSIPHAGPATPVESTGLSEMPNAGDNFHVVADVAKAKAVAEKRSRQAAAKTRRSARSHISLESISNMMREGKVKEIKLILKADVQGSLEVLRKALVDLSTPEVKLTLVHSATGGITTSDIELSDVSDAIVLGFNIVPEEKARSLAEEKGVDVRTYQVIYHMMDDMRNAMEGLLEPEEKEVVLGHVEIRQIFKISKIGTIAGCFVKDGKIERNNRIRLVRNSVIVYTGELDSLKRFKNDVKEVAEGFECGLKIKGYDDIKVGDVVESYEIQKVARKLAETAGGRG